MYPDSEILFCQNVSECIDKVISGEATCVIVYFDALLAESCKYTYNFTMQILNSRCNLCFASNVANSPLIEIVNKGVPFITDRMVNGLENKYKISGETSLSASLFFSKNPLFVHFIIMMIFAIFMIMCFIIVKRHFDSINREKLEKAMKLAREASDTKTKFLFNMSHDIRTPMNAIIGFTNMAIKNFDDKEKLAEILGKIHQSGDLLLTLINSILDMSQIESGKAKLEETVGDVTLSFSNIESAMQELAKAKNISLSFEIGDIQNRYVYADYDRCMRVFINIITNAIQYTKNGGCVKVKCQQISPVEKGYATYQYTFEDNGIGISPEFQKHLFEEFTRENNATTNGVQGSGVGLTVCKSFLGLMNGKIECKSQQGEGSTFIVTIPFRIQECDDMVEYIDPSSGDTVIVDAKTQQKIMLDVAGMRVLLVDDNEFNREIAIDILEEQKLEVETACDGSEAVEAIKKKGPDYYDFVLMDIQMPIMNGYEASKEIRRLFPDKHIPIVALSANAFEEDRRKSLASGMDEHISKPINIYKLKEVLAIFSNK